MKVLVKNASFGGGTVGKIMSNNALKLFLCSNSYKNLADLSPIGQTLDINGLTVDALGMHGSASNFAKTSLKDDSNQLTFRCLLKVDTVNGGSALAPIIGSYLGANLGGIGLFSWQTGSVSDGSLALQFRMAYTQKVVETGVAQTGVLAVNHPTLRNLSAPIGSTGYVYLVGKLDAINKLVEIKVMNLGVLTKGSIPSTIDASATARKVGSADLYHSVGWATGGIAAANSTAKTTVVKAEILNKYTSDIEDAAQYQADKEYISSVFGINVSSWL